MSYNSNERSLSRSFIKPGTRVSGNSSPSPEVTARHDGGDNGCQNACVWFGQSALRSIGLFGTLQPEDWIKAVGLIFLSRLGRAWEGVLESPWNEGPWPHPLGILDTSGKRSFLMLGTPPVFFSPANTSSAL